MKTEQKIIYELLNTLRDAEHNQDERLTERLLRGFLATYRPEILRKFYKEGHIVNDEVFQRISLQMNPFYGTTNEYSYLIPQVIRFRNNNGMYLEKLGMEIPLRSSEQYKLDKRNPIHKKRVFGKTEGPRIVVHVPTELHEAVDSVSELRTLLTTLEKEKANTGSILIDFHGVFVNPEDVPGYDWEKDAYPFPAEKLDDLKTTILRKEFGIMMQAKRDEVQNGRSDDIRYHENQNVNGAG